MYDFFTCWNADVFLCFKKRQFARNYLRFFMIFHQLNVSLHFSLLTSASPSCFRKGKFEIFVINSQVHFIQEVSTFWYIFSFLMNSILNADRRKVFFYFSYPNSHRSRNECNNHYRCHRNRWIFLLLSIFLMNDYYLCWMGGGKLNK